MLPLISHAPRPSSPPSSDSLNLSHRLGQRLGREVLVPIRGNEKVILDAHASNVPVASELLGVEMRRVGKGSEKVFVGVPAGLYCNHETLLEGNAEAEVAEEDVLAFALGEATYIVAARKG